MFKNVLIDCMEGKTLTEKEAERAMDEIMEGRATESQIASFLTVLRFRGETIDEMVGFTRSMRSHVVRIPHDEAFVIDTCGTGGDMSSTYNISTACAIGLSSFGIKVAKHGNRSVSSNSGSADALEELGLEVQTTPEAAAASLKEHHMAFLFAPLYHVAMKHAVTPRKEIGFRTIFNLLGPLTNPANADAQVIGVFSKEYGEKMAYTLQRLGAKRAMFVTGEDGLDEITITGKTYVTELKDGQISKYTITPEEVGLDRASLDAVQVASPNESAKVMYGIFNGEVTDGARDIMLINMAAGLYITGRVSSIEEGVLEAKASLEDGRILKQLQRLQNEKAEEQHA